jgi:hypothetical protein
MSPKTKYIHDQLSYYQINIRNLIRNRTTYGHANDQYTVCGDQVEGADFWPQATTNLEDVLKLTTFKSDDNLVDYEHRVIVFMNTDLAGQELQSNWQYIYDGFNTETNKVHVIRIWTDLSESQGLKKGAKVKFKMRKTDGLKKEYELTLKDLPYVTKQFLTLLI